MPPLKLDEPITWDTILKALQTVIMVGGIIWGASYFVASQDSSSRADAAELAAVKQSVASLQRESGATSNRLAVVETNIVFIREALSRIERAVSPRAP